MRKILATLYLTLIAILIPQLAFAATEIRWVGMRTANGGTTVGDIFFGNTCYVTGLGVTNCGVNASHISFFADNSISLELLYPLAAAGTGFPYATAGVWGIDNSATFRNRLCTGTKDNTTYLRMDGTCAVPPGSGEGGASIPTPVSIDNGGTSAITAAAARTALGSDNASNLSSGTVAKARGGFGASVDNATGVPVFASGAISWKTLTQFLAAVGVTFNSADNTWYYVAPATFADNVNVTGEVNAKGFNSTVADGLHDFNDANTGCNYTGTPSAGTTWFNPCTNTRVTYNGTYWVPQASYVSAPADNTSTCTPGQINATDNWLFVCVATNTWKTTHFDNTYRQVTHGDSTGGGGAAPPDNVYYSDNFNRTNETPLGGNWTTINYGGGEVDLISNQIVSSATSYNQHAFRNSESYTDNQWSSIVNKATSWASDVGGPTLRNRDNGGQWNGYIADVQTVASDNVDFWVKYGTTWEQVGTWTGLTLATNDNVMLKVSGNVFTLYINGVSKGTKTDTNNRIPSGGTPGFDVVNTDARWDDWQGGNN